MKILFALFLIPTIAFSQKHSFSWASSKIIFSSVKLRVTDASQKIVFDGDRHANIVITSANEPNGGILEINIGKEFEMKMATGGIIFEHSKFSDKVVYDVDDRHYRAVITLSYTGSKLDRASISTYKIVGSKGEPYRYFVLGGFNVTESN